jgi:UDP-N-acetylmuramyl-tripeptide synthetase
LKDLINLKKKGYKIDINWQDLTKKSIFFLNTNNKKNFINFQKYAIKKNCCYIICSDKYKNEQVSELIYFYFKDKKELYKIAKLFFKPLKLKLVFLTGTNGKTSVAYGSHQLMALNKLKTCYIGTLGFYINSKKIKNLRNTTPSFFEILILLSHAERMKVNYAFIEASSIGYNEGRLGYLKYNYCLLTNLKSDHLDYHGNLSNYHKSKLNIINNHYKKNSKILIQDKIENKKLDKIQNKIILQDDFIKKYKFDIIQKYKHFEIISNYRTYKIRTFNNFVIKNTISIIFLYFLILKKWPKKFTNKIYAKGRAEIVHEEKDALIMVDYAHSADAFENLLTSIPNYYKNKVVLYGCGGDRDITKRPKIAKTVSKYSSLQLITDDNPRNENPKSIRDTLLLNSKNAISIANRDKAIKYGVKLIKKKGGILIVAGKGHENTQIIKNKINKFSDQLIIKKYAKNI